MQFVGLLVVCCVGTGPQHDAIKQQVQAISATQKQASVLVRVGNETLFERYAPGVTHATLHDVHSCTKSVTAMAVGMVMEEGRLPGPDHSALALFPEIRAAMPPSERSRKDAILIRHLLSMSAGLEWNDSPENGFRDSQKLQAGSDWDAHVWRRPLVAPPGTVFNYNSGLSQLMASLVKRSTGESLESYVRDHLFEPLGIRSYRWWKTPDGNATAGWGLSLSLGDLVKLGELMREGGSWRGRRVLASSWVDAMTTRASAADASRDYGYQWWIFRPRPRPAYAALGAYGDHRTAVAVIPSRRMVIAVSGSGADVAPYLMVKDPESPAPPAHPAVRPSRAAHPHSRLAAPMIERVGHDVHPHRRRPGRLHRQALHP